MKPREYARRRAREAQREGVPYDRARVHYGRLTRAIIEGQEDVVPALIGAGAFFTLLIVYYATLMF